MQKCFLEDPVLETESDDLGVTNQFLDLGESSFVIGHDVVGLLFDLSPKMEPPSDLLLLISRLLAVVRNWHVRNRVG